MSKTCSSNITESVIKFCPVSRASFLMAYQRPSHQPSPCSHYGQTGDVEPNNHGSGPACACFFGVASVIEPLWANLHTRVERCSRAYQSEFSSGSLSHAKLLTWTCRTMQMSRQSNSLIARDSRNWSDRGKQGPNYNVTVNLGHFYRNAATLNFELFFFKFAINYNRLSTIH